MQLNLIVFILFLCHCRGWWNDKSQKQLHTPARDDSVHHVAKPPMTTVVDMAELESTIPVGSNIQADTKKERSFTTSIVTFEELDDSDEREDVKKGHSNKHKAVQKVKSAPTAVTRTQTESEDKV